jgi:hypothetical protein
MPEQTRQLDDWIAETPESIAARLDGAREAQKQTQFTLALMALISMVMLILSYNAYLSFDSDWILARMKEGIAPVDSATTAADILTHQALEDWAASRNATIGTPGHSCLWMTPRFWEQPRSLFFLSGSLLVTRRENHTVGSLPRDTDTSLGDEERATGSVRLSVPGARDWGLNSQRWLIYHPSSRIVFRDIRPLIVSYQVASWLKSTPDQNCPRHERRSEQTGALYFPATSSGFPLWHPPLFYLDRRSYFQPIHSSLNPSLQERGRPSSCVDWSIYRVLIPLMVCCLDLAARNSRATDAVVRAWRETPI